MTEAAVVVCTWGSGRDGVPAEAEELLTLGRRAGAALGAELHWLVLGATAENTSEVAARFGVAALDRIEDAKLAGFQPDPTVEALAQYCAQRSPKLLLMSQSFDARLVAPRLAGRLGCAVVMNGVDVATVMANAVAPEPLGEAAPTPTLQDVSVDLGGVDERIRVAEAARTEGPRLEDAEIIVAGGRGLGSPENYKLVEELANALGGMAGASRPIVDDGWVESSRQVGLTGKITRPALYVAAGISGASQHMAGCAAAKTIAAINRDPDAAIFRYARYGIVGDCVEILPELIRAAKEG
jgi:electron transfer flavoprotein alpha subunit